VQDALGVGHLSPELEIVTVSVGGRFEPPNGDRRPAAGPVI